MYVRVCANNCYVCAVCEGERAGETEYVLSVHNKVQFCGKNMDMICHFYPFVYYIYLFGQCRFGYFAVVRPLN